MGEERYFLECEKNRVFWLLMMSGACWGFYILCQGRCFLQRTDRQNCTVRNGSWKWKLEGCGIPFVPITAYGLGAAVSEVLPGSVKKAGPVRWDTLLVGFETLVILLLGFVPESAPFQLSQVAVNFICSMQYNTFRQAEGIPMATTFCTNHVRQTGIGLAEWLRKGDTVYLRRTLQHAGMLLMFLAGAVQGTILCGLFAGRIVWGASFLLFIVFADLLYADLTKEKGVLGRVLAGH